MPRRRARPSSSRCSRKKEADLKKGLPPGMTAYSFWAGRGTAKLRRLDNGGAQITFDFEGLIPYGLSMANS